MGTEWENDYICTLLLMAVFNFFGDGEHRVFHYRPRYYNEVEDERKRRFGKVDGTAESEKSEGSYKPGDYIRGSMRDRRYQTSRSNANKAQKIIGIIGLILIAVILIYIAKFYSLL